MENDDQQPLAAAAGAGQGPPHQSLVKLPAFWTEDPVSWFRLAEGQFALRNVTDPVAHYYHVLSSLLQDAVRLVHHILHEDTGPASYDNLRTFLLSSHSLSNYQKMERMMRLPLLGDRKPSVMLAEMLEYFPAGELATTVFAYLFLQCLPQDIRVLLSEDDLADMRTIADKADRLIAMHVPQGHDACATVLAVDEQEQDLVASTGGARRNKKLPLPNVLSSSRGVQASVAALFAATLRPRPPFLALQCVFTMQGTASRPSIVRRGACGRKTRVPGRCVGSSSRPPVLHHRQRLQPALSRGHRFCLLYYALGVP
jgi:hypothetical protein